MSILLLILLLLLLIFYIINHYLDTYENIYENFTSDPNLDVTIIIARYNEDLKWTLEAPFNQYKYIVYNKGENENFEKENIKDIITLPNVGKCDHTYLYHIIENYDNLSDITVFLPGSIDVRYKKRIASKLLEEMEMKKKAIFISLNQNDIKKIHYNFKLDKYKTTHKNNLTKNPESILQKSTIRPFGLWFDNMFGDIKVDCLIYYGIFSIHKDDIIQHPITRYENLIKELSNHSNPEVGHYFERSWCAVFHPLNNTYVIKYNRLR